ncbi:sensor histidine kinase [Paenibacillus sp. MWE-103]|uniref:Sensor histidine kinase n=1 Tax=Paenibacillus artemisiicola TaxID=1172618 RepID=A0ABS3WEJ6_9BACL|nr:sensor histidine kinase [Paenibacillus artemisiicola]MBO7746732.1 sensor histidine kinase [Paenibacillus artemisiicola]
MSNRLRLKLLAAFQSFIQSFSSSIKRKLFLVMMLLTCLPLIVLTVVAIRNAEDRLESEITRSNLSKIEWTGSFVDDQIQVLDQILFSLMNDQAVSTFMDAAQKPDDPVEFPVQNNLFDKLSAQYVSNLKSFDEIQLFKKDAGKVYAIRSGEERILNDQGSVAPWNALGGRKAAFIADPDPGHFTMYRSIYRFIGLDLEGGIALQVNWSMFNPLFESLKSGDSAKILILDDTGKVVLEPMVSGAATAVPEDIITRIHGHSGDHFYKSGKYYAFYQPFAGGKMTLVKLIPTSVVSESGKNTIWFSIWIVSILIVVSILFSIIVSNKATAPILKLVRAITWTEETNSEIYIGHDRQDEIGLLEQKYAQIIKSRYQIHIEKRTAQLKALQAQINPHFLHNTLQSIGAMAVVKDVPDIYHIIQAMSSNLRYTMKVGGDLVELKQEFEHIRNYLVIQKFRFKDKITLEWEDDSAAGSGLIPPLSLQPIVENAFEHGFRNKRGGWVIRIKTTWEPDKLRIEIADNGTGMSEQSEFELKERLSRNIEDIIESKESMALSNIHARMKTQFGSEFGLEIESEWQSGTRVTLVLPNLSAQGGGFS